MKTPDTANASVRVRWYDDAHTILHFIITGSRSRGGLRAGFFVRLNDLLDALNLLGVWEGLVIPIKGEMEGGSDD